MTRLRERGGATSRGKRARRRCELHRARGLLSRDSGRPLEIRGAQRVSSLSGRPPRTSRPSPLTPRRAWVRGDAPALRCAKSGVALRAAAACLTRIDFSILWAHTHLYGSTVFSPPLDGGWEDVGGLETSLTTAKVGRVKEHTCLDASAVRSGPETAEHASKRDVLYSVRI